MHHNYGMVGFEKAMPHTPKTDLRRAPYPYTTDNVRQIQISNKMVCLVS